MQIIRNMKLICLPSVPSDDLRYMNIHSLTRILGDNQSDLSFVISAGFAYLWGGMAINNLTLWPLRKYGCYVHKTYLKRLLIKWICLNLDLCCSDPYISILIHKKSMLI